MGLPCQVHRIIQHGQVLQRHWESSDDAGTTQHMNTSTWLKQSSVNLGPITNHLWINEMHDTLIHNCQHSLHGPWMAICACVYVYSRSYDNYRDMDGARSGWDCAGIFIQSNAIEVYRNVNALCRVHHFVTIFQGIYAAQQYHTF